MAIIKSKEYIRFWIATGVFILIVVLVGATIWMKKEIKPEVILSVVGGYAALYFGLNKHWMEGDKMFRELFTEFNDRFNEMNEDLNKIFNNDKREDGKTDEEIIQDYLNLCSEEYLWYKRGRIDKKIWNAWKGGAEYYLKCEKIRVYFEEESQYNKSYYGVFDSLKMPNKIGI